MRASFIPMNLTLHDLLVQHIKDALVQCEVPDVQAQDICLDLPTDSRFGDLSTAVAMRLGKRLKTNPRQIAEKIIASLETALKTSPAGECVREIRAEGSGFINFYLRESYFYRRLADVLQKGRDAFRSSAGGGKKVLIEFVSANPTGPLSVAHARQAAVGDSLANILNFMGFEVSREYYLNDEGNQITILGDSVRLRQDELKGREVVFPGNYYQGEYIYDIARVLAGQPGDTQAGDFAAGYILDIIRRELDDFGVHFDCWYSQKELGKSGKVEQALADLRRQE
ncbi:MAG: arginine--tRNA ligase, partial [Candidatus Omnitrophica bacterium]|nr:arginine--tRNA ligase [Candidatus Omnitrophota bacterium]